MIPLYKVFVSPEAGKEVYSTLYSGYLGQGQKVEQFEQELSRLLEAPRVLALNSCTSALHLALHLLKQPDGEVITTPLTCFAAISGILATGQKIVWSDVDYTGNIDVEQIAQRLSLNTTAVLVVHLAGMPVYLHTIQSILDEHYAKTGRRVVIIEDCAHAFGSVYQGQPIGAFPRSIRCFSFQAVKILTTGDGGAILLPDQELYDRAKLLRWYGLDRNQDRHTQDIQESGFKYHMNDLAASIGLANLEYVDQAIEKQKRNRTFYYSTIDGHISLPPEDGSVCSLFPVLVRDRHHFEERLHSKGVEVLPPHVRCDKYSCVKEFATDLPRMDLVEHQLTCLPAGWWVKPEELKQIAKWILGDG